MMELPSFVKNFAVRGDDRFGTISSSKLDNKEHNLGVGGKSSFDEEEGPTVPSTHDGRQQSFVELQEENARLQLQVDFMEKELAGMVRLQQQHIALRKENRRHLRAPSLLRQTASHSPSKRIPQPFSQQPKRRHRRRWSFSSARNGEMDSLGQDNEETIGLVHDELETHESGGGLHHRRFGGSSKGHGLVVASALSPKRPLARKSSDDSQDLADEDDSLLFGSDMADGGRAFGGDENEPFLFSSFWQDLRDRANWLVGLMILQSLSSFIIKRNEEVLEEHLVIVQFLTMLVGAGGNAGNQASVRGEQSSSEAEATLFFCIGRVAMWFEVLV